MQKELTNEKLEQAISVLLSDRKKENLEKVMDEMKTSLLYVPSGISEETKKRMEQIKNGEQVKLPINPLFLKNQNGVSYLPVYTSREHLPKDQKYPMMFTLPFAECNRLAIMAKDKVSGIVVNPFTNNLVLNINVPAKEKAPVPQPVRQVSPEQKQILLRKTVEMGMIPQRLFKEKGAFVEMLSEKREEGLLELFQTMYGTNAVCPYQKDDFNMIVMDISDSLRLLDMEMPEQYCEEGCAKSIYIGWNPKNDHVRYYVITKATKEKPAMLLELLEGGKMKSLGEAPADGGEVFHMMERCNDL